MNIEDMKKIWDSEGNQTLYVLNESKVESIVNKKSLDANKRASYVENFIITVNLVLPIALFIFASIKEELNFGEWALILFSLLSAMGTYYYKRVRISNQLNAGDAMLDNLDQAIHNATYQARMTQFILTWYIIGVASLMIYNMIREGTNIWFIVGISFTFIVAWFVGRWEQKCWHDKKRDELIALKRKLME